MMSEGLDAVLKRVVSVGLDEEDTRALLLAVQQKQVALATGERAVAFGANASDVVVVTGDSTRCATRLCGSS